MTAGAPHPPARLPSWPLLTGAAVVTAICAGLAVISPKLGIAAVVAVAVAAGIGGISGRPLHKLMVPFVGLLVVAALLGPNLAVPQGSGVFLFRVMIVVLGIGLIGYLLMGGALRFPAAIGVPASILGLLLAWALMSLAWAENISAAIRWTSFLAMMVGVTVAIPICFTNRRRVIVLLKVLAWTFAGVTAFSFIEIATGIRLPTSRLAGGNGGDAFAATSVFGNQNNFATFLTLALPYFLVLPFIFRERKLRVIGLVGTLSALMALLLTGSKDNLIAAALVFLTILFFLATDPAQRAKLIGVVVVVAIALAVVVPTLSGSGLVPLPKRAVDKFSFSLLMQEIKTGQGSGAARKNLLNDGIHFVGESGGIGVGAGNAETHVLELPVFPGVSNLHDWWLEVAVDLGLVGLALYVAFYLTLLIRQLRGARRSADPLVRYLCLSGTAAMVGFVIGSLGPSTMISFSPMWVMFGVSLTAIAVAERARRNGGMLQ
jgi:teichuronic acid biosynthesis protein TuaE